MRSMRSSPGTSARTLSHLRGTTLAPDRESSRSPWGDVLSEKKLEALLPRGLSGFRRAPVASTQGPPVVAAWEAPASPGTPGPLGHVWVAPEEQPLPGFALPVPRAELGRWWRGDAHPGGLWQGGPSYLSCYLPSLPLLRSTSWVPDRLQHLTLATGHSTCGGRGGAVFRVRRP